MGQELPPPLPAVDDAAEPSKVRLADFTEAALGGPLVDSNGDFLGMIHRHDHGTSETWYLPLASLRERLMHFGILKKGEDSDDDDAEEVSSKDTTHFRRDVAAHAVPPRSPAEPPASLRSADVEAARLSSSLAPPLSSGSIGLGFPHLSISMSPSPPPDDVNVKLLNTFEDDFGEVSGWQGYEHNLNWRSAEYVWHDLPKNVFTNTCRRVVSVVSFKGNNMFFACTGLLISWHERTRTCTRTSTGMSRRMRASSVILTSASLVRSRDDEDKIYEYLRIEVFLPPNQRANGTLQLYHLNYNIAVISIEKHFLSTRPENIFYPVLQKPFKEVVAIGRDHAEGLLLATMGEVTFSCPLVGIGGPLINSHDGCFVGMNFYDDTDKTPFLPRSRIIDVLKGVDLPSQRGLNCPANMMDEAAVKKNRWPVSEAYWYW
ncbi:hypothetical protein ZWY2020_029765 [Hordeum vulgare]|nr:hypothetical protein ZWY2020_029765 [Hordeum vulgare]